MGKIIGIDLGTTRSGGVFGICRFVTRLPQRKIKWLYSEKNGSFFSVRFFL